MTETTTTEQGIVVTDKRRAAVAGFAHLPVQNGAAAQEIARADIRSVAKSVAPYEAPSKTVAEPEFDMKQLELLWGEFLRWHEQHRQAKGWTETFKELLQNQIGPATLLTLGGRKVATYRRNGPFDQKRFREEQPDLVAQYTKLLRSEQFDMASFKNELPGVHAQYLSRRLVLVSESKGTTLTLP